MKKQLRFLYRYLVVARRWRRWVNTHTVMAAFISLVFFTTLSWNTPFPSEKPRGNAAGAGNAAAQNNLAAAARGVTTLQQTPTPDATLLEETASAVAAPTRTRTPFPAEFYTNADQTAGVTLAGAALVLIVVVGLISFLPKREEEEK